MLPASVRVVVQLNAKAAKKGSRQREILSFVLDA